MSQMCGFHDAPTHLIYGFCCWNLDFHGEEIKQVDVKSVTGDTIRTEL